MFTKTELIILSFICFFAVTGAVLNRFIPPPVSSMKTMGVGAFSVRALPSCPDAFKRMDESHPKSARIPLKVDINRADTTELMRLPGVGVKLAREIVRFREAKGPFRTPSDLLSVKGIGRKKLAKMAEDIKI